MFATTTSLGLFPTTSISILSIGAPPGVVGIVRWSVSSIFGIPLLLLVKHDSLFDFMNEEANEIRQGVIQTTAGR